MNRPLPLYPDALWPADQAQGLRERFARPATVVLPLPSNAFNHWGGLMLERLCSAFAALDHTVLVVDGGERSPEPGEWSAVSLQDAMETLSPRVRYLAARGLSRRFMDHQGHCEGLMPALSEACPQASVILVHAPAQDLSRLGLLSKVPGQWRGPLTDAKGAPLRVCLPLVMVEPDPDSYKQAYANIKLMHQRGATAAFDLLISSGVDEGPLPEQLGEHLGQTTERFLGVALRHVLAVSPEVPPDAPPDADWMAWSRAALNPTGALAPVDDALRASLHSASPWGRDTITHEGNSR